MEELSVDLSMKLLLDENISNEIKKILEKAQFDVVDLKTQSSRQLPDKSILEIATREDRIIITHDKDFLPFIRNSQSQAKIILIVLHPHTEERVLEIGSFLVTSRILTTMKKSAIVKYLGDEITFTFV